MTKKITMTFLLSLTAPSAFVVAGAASAGCAATHSTVGESQKAQLFPLPARVEVPASPDMTVERFTVIAAPPEVIYRVLAAASDWPTWDPSVTVARQEAPRPLGVGDRFFKEESGFAIEARVLDAEPGRLLRWRGSPPGGGVVGVHSYRLVPIGEGRTLVVDREEFSRWYLRLFGWATDLRIGRQYQATLEALRTTAESSVGAVSSEN